MRASSSFRSQSFLTAAPVEEDARDLCWNLLMLFCAFMGMSLLPEAAAAQQQNIQINSFQEVVTALTGLTGKAVAAVGVIALGVTALFGKLSWGRAALGAAGIGVIFGGASIVAALGATANNAQANNGPDILLNNFNAIIGLITSPLGIALSTLAVIAAGISALYGKMSYQAAMLVAMGIAMVFGGASIVSKLGAAAQQTPQGGANALEIGFNYIIGRLTGPVGMSIATIGIMILGLGAMFGKISYPAAIVFTLGITLVFGGANIVQTLSAGGQAEAVSTNSVTHELSLVSHALTGTTGVTLATIAVGILGIGAFFGKISFPTAILVATGIALIFGAAAIINTLHGANNLVQRATWADGDQGNPIASNFSNIVNFMQSELGITLGILAVSFIGIGALFGKVSFPAALITTIGITLMFGSVSLVHFLTDADQNINLQKTDCFATVMGNFGIALQGPTAKALASIAVIILGIGAMLGKISYATALTFITGVGVTFGSERVIDYFGLSTAQHGGAIGVPGGQDYISNILCTVMAILTGAAGKSIATIAIVMLGIGAMLGKVSYQLALTVVAGLSCMFGATGIVHMLNPAWNNVCVGALPQQNCG